MGFYDDRPKRVAVFEDTIDKCTNNQLLNDALKKSVANQIVYLEGTAVNSAVKENISKKCKIIVSRKRTFEAAMPYAKEGKKVCVLNFASATSPGGGVAHGAGAQEECLCRCSTLYPAIDVAAQDFHNPHYQAIRSGKMNNMYNDDCIFTPDVVVFKSDILLPEMMAESDWYNVDVITCAAPHLHRDEKFNPDTIFEIHKKRLSRILQIAEAHGAEVLILGAFGCGAFRNPPELVAKAEKEAIANFGDKFDAIEFAVFCPPDNSQNFDAFRNVFGEGES